SNPSISGSPMSSTTSAGPSTPLVSVPEPGASIDDFVRHSVAAPGSEYERRGSWRVASGTVVRYVQRYSGVLVRDGGCAVLVSPSGNVLDVHDFSAGGIPAAPVRVITAADAAAAARAVIGGADPGDDLARTFLVWTREFGYPRMVYECDLQPALQGLPDAPRVLLAAETGRVLLRASRVRDFTGDVFAGNPIVTPDTIDATLTGLPDGSDVLEGDDVHSFNCVDTGAITSFGGMRAHLCVGQHTEHADSAGHYTAPTGMPMDPSSGYGELSMYYHTTDFLRFIRALGFTNFRTRPLSVYANVRFPWNDANFGGAGTDLTGPLVPWDNAAFIPGTPPNILGNYYGRGHDVIMFGLGTSTNFSYDGDVVAHESGHSLVASTADFGDAYQDQWGTDGAPGALNEGLADYFSAARAGDPNVGEFAGQFEGGAIRSLDSAAHYPEDLQGEVHNDSLPSSTALWSLRTRLGAEFDRAVYEALVMESPRPSHFSLATRVVAAAARILGPTAGDAATSEYTTRGIFPDGPRVKTYQSNGTLLTVPGATYSHLPFVPGYFQIRRSLPAHTYRVNVEIRVHAFSDYNPTMHVTAHVGGPVVFQYTAANEITSNAEADFGLVDPGTHRLTGTFDVTPRDTAQDLYVSLGMEDGDESSVTARFLALQEVVTVPDAGTPADGSARSTRYDVVGGWSCATRPSSPSHARPNAALGALALAGAVSARRRCRGSLPSLLPPIGVNRRSSGITRPPPPTPPPRTRGGEPIRICRATGPCALLRRSRCSTDASAQSMVAARSPDDPSSASH
ncbi:MAG: hypothetical protein WCJ30_15885, partial [Deltaproteobacteria bacterium]